MFLTKQNSAISCSLEIKLEREGEFDLISRRAHSKLRHINVITELLSTFLVWSWETGSADD